MIVLVQDPAEPLASPDVQVGDLVLSRSKIESGW
jgi:hypothetical protein